MKFIKNMALFAMVAVPVYAAGVEDRSFAVFPSFSEGAWRTANTIYGLSNALKKRLGSYISDQNIQHIEDPFVDAHGDTEPSAIEVKGKIKTLFYDLCSQLDIKEGDNPPLLKVVPILKGERIFRWLWSEHQFGLFSYIKSTVRSLPYVYTVQQTHQNRGGWSVTLQQYPHITISASSRVIAVEDTQTGHTSRSLIKTHNGFGSFVFYVNQGVALLAILPHDDSTIVVFDCSMIAGREA